MTLSPRYVRFSFLDVPVGVGDKEIGDEMSVLVTGGAGYIGSHMVYELLDHGEDVVVIDDLSTGRADVLPKTCAFIKGDIGNQDLLSQILESHKVNAIIHFAGSIVVPESVEQPLEYYENNTVKSRSLIESAVRARVSHFIFSSTAAVYGMPKQVPIAEDMPFAPISPYGASKMMTEMMLRDTAAVHPMRYAALRYFNVAGADPDGRTGQSSPKATHLIKVASQAAQGKRDHLDVYGTDYETPDGTCIRDYIHVSDLANAHWLALQYLREGGDSLVANCGYGHGYSVLEVIEAVKRVSGVDFKVDLTGRRAGDPAALVADSTFLKETVGWQAQYADLDKIVSHALQWEKKLGNV